MSAQATTYGEHQERAAASYAWLVSRFELPVHDPEISATLACRRISIDAVRERVALLGAGPRALHSPVVGKASGGPVIQLGKHLDSFLEGRDRFPEGFSPADELTRESFSESHHHWQSVARHLVLGNDSLSGDPAVRDWLNRPGSLWHLVGDAANTVEAAAFLDQDLAGAGLLPITPGSLDAASGHSDLDRLRRDVSYTARNAAWYATDPSPDLAVSWEPLVDEHGTHLVTTASDLAPGLRQLTRFLHPRAAGDAFHDPERPNITAREASQASKTLLRLSEAMLAHTTHPGTREHFTGVLEDLHAMEDIHRLTDTRTYRPQPALAGQLGELARGLQRYSNKLRDLSPAQLLDIASATRGALSGGLAPALKRELNRPDSTLLLRISGPDPDSREVLLGHRPSRKHPLYRATQDAIAHDPAREPDRARDWWPDMSRRRIGLRATLDATPTTRPPQYPTPRGRDDFGR